MAKYKYIVRDRETGNAIEGCMTIEEARRLIKLYEAEDRYDEIFIENFYEIYDVENKEIVY